VVTPARPVDTPRIVVPDSTAVAAGPSQPLATRRVAARAAARRRRHILSFLVIVDLAVAALAWFVVLPRWSVAVPVALTLGYLILCRTQVRRDDDASWTRDVPEAAEDEGSLAPRRAIRVEAPHGAPRAARNSQGFEEVSPEEDTVAISVASLRGALGDPSYAETETVAVSVPTADGGSLWDPLPVTLPTYVSKPRASRTVRTIDLTEPGTWSSGRSDADTKLVEEAVAAKAESAVEEQNEQRAVGS
jgi:hypothetical protein